MGAVHRSSPCRGCRKGLCLDYPCGRRAEWDIDASQGIYPVPSNLPRFKGTIYKRRYP